MCTPRRPVPPLAAASRPAGWRGGQTLAGSTATRSRPGGRAVGGQGVAQRGVVGGPHQPAPVGRARSPRRRAAPPRASTKAGAAGPDTSASAVTGGKRSSSRRSRSAAATRAGSACSAACTTSCRGRVWSTSRPPALLAAHQPGRPGHQPERLLGRPVPRGQQLLVEVEEGDDVGRVDLVQGGLGADHDPRPGRPHRPRRRAAGDLGHRLADQGLELVADPGHALAQRLHAGGAAGAQTTGRVGAAAGAAQLGVVGLGHGRVAPLAPGQLAARPAGEQPGPAGAVEDAQHPAVAPQGADERRWQQPGARVLVVAVDDVDDGPARPARRPATA